MGNLDSIDDAFDKSDRSSDTADKIFGPGTSERLENNTLDKATLNKIRKYNNPDKAPTGHFTGRCMKCHSNNLWDDMTAYGCNFCGAIYSTSDLPPKLVPNGGAPETPEIAEYNRAVDALASEEE